MARRRKRKRTGPRTPAARLAFEEQQALDRERALRREVEALRRAAETGLVELLAGVIRASETKPMAVTLTLKVARRPAVSP